MLKTGREKLKRLLLALLLAALCPLFAYTQDAGQGAQSNSDTNGSTIEESARSGAPEEGAQSRAPEESAQSRAPEESELRFADAEAPATEGEEIRPVTDLSIWDFVRMVLVLALVVALIYGLFYLLKRAQGSQSEQSGIINVLATQSLPGNGMVHLVKVGTQIFMLGSSEHSLRLLTEIDDKESRDEVELRVAEIPQTERRSFSDLMSAMLGSFGREGSTENGETEGAGGRFDSGPAAVDAAGSDSSDSSESSEAPRASSAERRPSSAEARAEQEVLEYISSQRQRLRRLNS